MAKITTPITFSDFFGLDSSILDSMGVLDPTLALDTKLFIDPMLLEASKHKEINTNAVSQFNSHFENIIKLLSVSTKIGDVPWRNARHLFNFYEIKATCLGYGKSSISGSAFGPKLISHVMKTAKEIVDFGIKDPDLFVLMALFENDIGPDRISDMTTNVILDSLLEFNKRVNSVLKVPTKRMKIHDRYSELPQNPLEKNTPILLVPTDILRKLPLASDWDEVVDAASKNAELRSKINSHVSHLWAAKSKRDKLKLKRQVLSTSEAFETLLSTVQSTPKNSYDVKADPDGIRKWAEVGIRFANAFPLEISKPDQVTLDEVYSIVESIVSQFKQLIEKNGLSKSLWNGEKPLSEQYSQRLFFAIAHSYCKSNNLDISPEADAGRGPVDFKISSGSNSKVLVEVKLSTNTKLVDGYYKQLEAYKEAEEAIKAIYLIIDVGRMGKKDQRLYKIRNEQSGLGEQVSDIEIIDGIPKPSASKL